MKAYKLIPLLVIIIFSCKKEKDIPAVEVGSMDVGGAKLMMITGTMGGANNEFYKITNTDEVKRVIVYDQFGAEIPDKIVGYGAYNVNENNFMMHFTQGGRATFLMFNKTTSAMTDLYGAVGLPVVNNGMGDMNNRFSRSDSSHNVYFIAAKGNNKSIIKLNKINQNISTVITGNNILDFTIDGYGNILYHGGDSIAVLKAGGGHVKTPLDFQFEQHWIDADGKINYNSGSISQGNYDPASNSYVFSQKNSNPFSTSIRKINTYFVKYNDKVIAFSNYQSEILELDNTSNTMVTITSIPMNSFIAGGFSKSKSLAYIAGNDNSGSKNIFKINLANNYSHTAMLSTNMLSEIYDIEAFEDGTVYAGGKRASDNKYVLLKIDDSGAITTINETLTQPCYQLEKISEFVFQNH